MEFYMAEYTEHMQDGNSIIEMPYRQRRIIVIADSIEEAKRKIDSCLGKINTGSCKISMRGQIKRCEGIQVVDVISGTNILPIEI